MFDTDLQFPHTYELSEPPEQPGSGRGNLQVHYIPTPEKREEHDGMWIRVRPAASEEWIGVFAGGYGSPPSINKLLSTPMRLGLLKTLRSKTKECRT